MTLQNACFNCHSDHTIYPWYSNITPINYWLSDHINTGKKHFNMSKWNDYDDKVKDEKLGELMTMVEEKEMPLKPYIWLHKESDLTQKQIDDMASWAKIVRLKYMFLETPQ